MRTSIILGRKDGGNEVSLVSGPLPPHEQNAKFKELIDGDGDGFAEIHLHELTLSGGRKRQNFKAPQDSKAQAARLASMSKPKKSHPKKSAKRRAPKKSPKAKGKTEFGKPAPDKTDGRGPTFAPPQIPHSDNK